ncbi:hypothetical protein JXR93_05005 [bacterium]|nr:hypothetical protein [bacterium]
MKKLGSTIDKLIYKSSIIIENSLSDDSIKAEIGKLGYTEEDLKRGKELLDSVKEILQKRKEVGFTTDEKRKEYNEAKEIFLDEYNVYVKLARVAFRDDDSTLSLLALNGLRKRNLDSLFNQAERFYKSALSSEAVLSGLQKFRITKENIQSSYEKFKKFVELNAEVTKEQGNDIILTKEKNDKLEKFERWIRDYVVILEIAFRDNREALSKLGI